MTQTKLTQEQLNDVLIQAAVKGDLDALKKAHEQGADIYAKNNYALSCAAHKGHSDIVRYLVEEHDADIHAHNDDPIRYATMNGHLDLMRYLLEKGADYKAIIRECFTTHSFLSSDPWSEDKLKALFTVDFMYNHLEAAIHLWSVLPEGQKNDNLRQQFRMNYFLALQNLRKKPRRIAQPQQKKTGTNPS